MIVSVAINTKSSADEFDSNLQKIFRILNPKKIVRNTTEKYRSVTG